MSRLRPASSFYVATTINIARLCALTSNTNKVMRIRRLSIFPNFSGYIEHFFNNPVQIFESAYPPLYNTSDGFHCPPPRLKASCLEPFCRLSSEAELSRLSSEGNSVWLSYQDTNF